MRSIHSVPLRERFLLLLLPVVVGAPAIVGLVGQSLLKHNFEEELESDLSSQMLSHVLPLTARMETLRHELRVLALTPHAGGTDAFARGELSDGWQAQGAMLLARSPEVSEIFFVHSAGEKQVVVRCTRQGIVRETHPQGDGRPWTRIDSDTRIAQEGFQLDRAGGQLWAIEPVESVPGLSVGMFLQDSLFESALAPLQDERGTYAVVVTPDGDVIHASGEGYRRLDSIFDATAPCAVHVGEGLLSGNPVTLCTHSGKPLIIASHRNPTLHLVAGYVVPRSIMTADQALFDRLLWAIIGATVLVSVLIFSLLAGWGGRPIRDLSLGMEAVARGELDRRVDARGDDEVARLAQSFNAMVADLQATQVALRSQSRQLEIALREVESVDAMKDSFLALVSHEVRTPLTSIMGGIEYLKDDHFGERDETETEFMNIVYESCQRLAGFMNDAILMASLQATKGKTGFAEFSLTKLLIQGLEEQQDFARRREVETVSSIDGIGELFLHGDWTLMQVALRKILHNGYWHNAPQGRIQVDVVDRIQEDGTPVVELISGARRFLRGDRAWRAVRVFNTGPIIPSDKIDTLFRRFELTHDIENHQRGSGLSLPIVRYVLELHDGAVAVREAAGGMAFYLVLPLRQTESVVVPDGMDLDGMDETVATAHLLEIVQRELQETGEFVHPAEKTSDRDEEEEIVSASLT